MKKPVELVPRFDNQVAYSNAGQTVNTTAGPYFAYLYLGNPDDPGSSLSDISWAPGYGAMSIGNNPASFFGSALGGYFSIIDQQWPTIVNRDNEPNNLGAVILDTSLVTETRRVYFQDKPGPIAMASDIPASNVKGETHFDGADPSTASVFGIVASVTSTQPGVYDIIFTADLADTDYGIITGVAGASTEAWTGNPDNARKFVGSCRITTKVFDPGILGVALPSFTDTDPPLVTVIITKNP